MTLRKIINAVFNYSREENIFIIVKEPKGCNLEHIFIFHGWIFIYNK